MFHTLASAFRSAAALALVFSLSGLCQAGKPLPAENALNSAKKLIIETFRKELSATDKVPAVKSMLETAASTSGDDPAQAALYLSAADIAARAGETKLAFEALEQLAAAFDCDVLALKLTALETAVKYAKTPESRVSVANRCLELVDDAAKARRFDIADDALKAAASTSSKVKDAELRKDIAAKRKQIEKTKRQHEHELAAVEAANKTLKEKPNDPDANETIGKHLVFDGNDWTAGLKHLAKASDPDLQKAALADQSGATESSQSAALGDGWWNLGDRAENARDKAGYHSRAVFWYTRAASGLTGFAKARIEKRLKEAGEAALTAAADQSGNDNGKFIDITLAPGVLLRLVKIPASADGKIKSFYLGQTEVTQKQWAAVMGSNPSTVKGEQLPVVDVSQMDCMAFTGTLSKKGRYNFRLPTADEWLHAYDNDIRPKAARNISDFAWHKGNTSGEMHKVGEKLSGGLGLFDIAGNALELTADPVHIYGGSVAILIPAGGDCFIQEIPAGAKHVELGFRVYAEAR